MTERELKAAAVGIITYACLLQTGSPPPIDEEGMLEATAFLVDELLEQTLQICAEASLDDMELFEVEEDDS